MAVPPPRVGRVHQGGQPQHALGAGNVAREHPRIQGDVGRVRRVRVRGILAFIGFDAAARLGEEARDPKRTIKFAVVGSALLVGLYYLLATYAASVFFGPDRMGNFPTFNDSNPWIGMARQVWGVGWVFVFIVLLNSAQENINGVANAGTRVMWSMGRIGLLPRAFARVSPRYRTPSTATIFNFVVGTGIAIALGVKYQPTVAFGLRGPLPWAS